jgi:hypothetical protein
MKPPEVDAGMPPRVDAHERAKGWLHDACDERRPIPTSGPDAERHLAGCADCQADAALFLDLEKLLASEPAIEPPPELVPAVLSLVRADLARARRNARLAFLGAIAALVALAVGVAFFDLSAGAAALAKDALSWAELARAATPAAPDLGRASIELPASSWAWGALALAALIVVAEVRFLVARRAAG